ncbi:DUF2946 domain-containing protein [Duganella sp. FT109W]|uniref:DUF2946 domain-containing protein n=1 Tax=Duganella margarita TaxID=2692170 RepID=A0ABW9WPP4_9BURK|nr:DUF2946 domain-containing protein [Duganella margarita]
MKKILLILLLTILPIQYAWSMAAVYCQHEENKVSHFGHHGHQHQAQSDDDTDHSKPSKHGDCEVCHHAVQASVPAAEPLMTVAPAAVFAPAGVPRYHSYIADGPPRPNWTLVA